MAQTFNDFLKECDMYAHSKEHYEIMKESAELNIINQFIEDQKFLRENSEEVGAANLETGFFKESASEDELQSYIEAAEEKKKGLIGRIMAGWKKLVKSAVTLWGKLFKKFGEYGIDELNSKIAKYKFTKSDVDTITALYSKNVTGKGITVDVLAKNKSLNGIKPSYEEGFEVSADDNKAVLASLCMSTQVGPIRVLLHDGRKAVDINDAIDYINYVNDAITNGKADVYARLAAELSKKFENPAINVDFSDIDDINAKLEKIRQQDATEAMEKEPDAGTPAAAEAITAFRAVINGTTTFYKDILEARASFTNIYSTILDIKKA